MRRQWIGTLFAAAVGGGVTALLMLSLGEPGADTRTTVVAPLLTTRGALGHTAGSGSSAAEIYRRAAPGVVFVRASTLPADRSGFDVGDGRSDGDATGSGFVLDDRGRILTNAHVIRAATDITVTLADGRARRARALGKDDVTDLALLEIDPEGLDLEPLPLGNSEAVQVGDPTVALGNPTGAASTLTTGVVSAVGQRLEAADGSFIDDVIQTDAAGGAGNAGGPLLDGRGAVIGVNSHIATSNGPVAFAVPVDTVRAAIPQLQRTGHVAR